MINKPQSTSQNGPPALKVKSLAKYFPPFPDIRSSFFFFLFVSRVSVIKHRKTICSLSHPVRTSRRAREWYHTTAITVSNCATAFITVSTRCTDNELHHNLYDRSESPLAGCKTGPSCRVVSGWCTRFPAIFGYSRMMPRNDLGMPTGERWHTSNSSGTLPLAVAGRAYLLRSIKFYDSMLQDETERTSTV